MKDQSRLEFLAGQIHALVGFATAVVTSHPNPVLLAQHLEKVGQINLAMAEGETVSDHYIEGVQDMQHRLKQAAETVLAQRKQT